MSSVACCTIDVVRTCCPSLVACCMLPPGAHALKQAAMHARARATCTRGRSLSVWPWPMRRSGAKPRSPCALTVHWPQLPRHTMLHSSCTASITLERCRLAARADRGQLQRCREGAAGRRDGGAPGRLVRRAAASLQGTRGRWALVARMLHRARCCW